MPATGSILEPNSMNLTRSDRSQGFFFPSEILDEIVYHILSSNHTFSTIEAFSRVSFRFRQIALRSFFAKLDIYSKAHWINVCGITGVYSWTRELSSLSTSLSSAPGNLLSFQDIRTIELDFSNEGLNTQHNRATQIFLGRPSSCSTLGQQISTRISLTTLRLSYLPRIDTALLALISGNFPALKILALTCSERLLDDCCWDCYEEASSCTTHSPIPDMYCNAEDLSVAFGSALSPLRNLQSLHLGIYLSEMEIFYYHIYHSDLNSSLRPTNHSTTIFNLKATSSSSNSNSNPPWSLVPYGPNMCSHCDYLYSEDVRKTELYASASIARFLPALKEITWSSFFAQDNPGDDPDEGSTMVWIRRKEGKIRVRRAPW
ncbi:hypothetical protein ABKN59_009222 [Abortiporus biennis]